jgi:hypothetical protein
VDRGLGLIRRFAGCFTDRRDPRYVEHRIETLVGQRIFGLVLYRAIRTGQLHAFGAVIAPNWP